MQPEAVPHFYWPAVNSTVSIVAVVVALVIFLFAAFTGARANKARVAVAVVLATVIGWLSLPMLVRGAQALGVMDTKGGEVAVITVAMLFVALLATGIYEILTVTLSDVGLASRK